MKLSKRYNPNTREVLAQELWQEQQIYQYDEKSDRQSYVIDTPPPTVSGYLHLGHVYSYSHTDFFARFWRMNNRNVLYPMGYDDNGLPTERLVEQRLNIKALEIGREAFIERCLEVSREAEVEYERLWKRLGLSVDWRYTYRTIDDQSRRISQQSFIDLYRKGLVYQQKAPAIWCPECQTAIAQAEVADLKRETEFVILDFRLEDGSSLPIATTRPELLPACVAIFVHPEDSRYQHLVGKSATIPIFERSVPIQIDPDAEIEKGTGAVMCCTFGDSTDVAWWFKHKLELIEAVSKTGRMTRTAGILESLSVSDARSRIKQALMEESFILDRHEIEQSVRVHERCDTPVEYIVTSQWFIRILDYKESLLSAGKEIKWYPEHMLERYLQWVENLNWDWCISRQRFYGVAFPVWFCDECGETVLAENEELPVDPMETQPQHPCSCGSTRFGPETDVMDTWATSSMTPQIVARCLERGGFDGESFEPVSLRPQAHDIIRTWAFYSVVKSFHHFGKLPWKHASISGWALAPAGAGKISKSRGGGPVAPMEMIEQYSADAVRYWAASTRLGKDAIISVDRIQAGAKLITKIWNVARFSQRFFEGYQYPDTAPPLSAADKWLLSRMNKLIGRVSQLYKEYDYATVKSEVEQFFWNELADNYLEMAKKRLYDLSDPGRDGARYSLYSAIITLLKLFAPILPHITESIYLELFATAEAETSIHRSTWPVADNYLIDERAEHVGASLVQIATAIRRYKSESKLSLGTEIATLILGVTESSLIPYLREAESDIMSITRAKQLIVDREYGPDSILISNDGQISIAINK